MIPETFSKKQLRVLSWWNRESGDFERSAIICDGAVRSGKTYVMSLSFVLWSFYSFNGAAFGICSKTIRSVRRNIINPLLGLMRELGFSVKERVSENYVDISKGGHINRFYYFGGKDEGSAALIQGMTLSGILLDEAALMPRSFVEQALARCSVEGARMWFNCNPDHPDHWFRREWILKCSEKNALYLHFTMDDNPALTESVKERYRSLYSGAFYKRFVEGRWCAAAGAVYPFMDNDDAYYDVPSGEAARYIISCDYGTVNPSSFGLWGEFGGVWYRVGEYYYSSLREGGQRTDEEHYAGLEQLAAGHNVELVIVDPSAASFIQTIKRHSKFDVVRADNRVIDGIRQVSCALSDGKIRICRTCRDAKREFSLYHWDESGGKDAPVKENDHAMDDIRYFVTYIMNEGETLFVTAVKRKR
ncbi:MAG: PBSX family phage terminase large subunit [Clostridia bacterium]|nr:PBSX family phage terminase large subunit [Clostridia bacterium]